VPFVFHQGRNTVFVTLEKVLTLAYLLRKFILEEKDGLQLAKSLTIYKTQGLHANDKITTIKLKFLDTLNVRNRHDAQLYLDNIIAEHITNAKESGKYR